MARMVVLYGKPKDPAAFAKHYAETHIPIAKKIPGVRRYVVSEGPVVAPRGENDVHFVAMLDFDSLDAIKASFATPQGQAAAEDVKTFADGGSRVYLFDTKDV